jgi:5-formyltetrahydrofolate cyclo-ligase
MQKISDMSIQDQKAVLRKYIKTLKHNLSAEEMQLQSNEICSLIEQMDEFKNADIVLLYWAMNDEVNLFNLIQKWYQHKTLLLPCVTNDILEIRQFTGFESMKQGPSFGIPEPIGELFKSIDAIELAIIPGIAYDINNNRMGRGKAYYDRFLNHTQAIKVGVCFNVQLFEQVPHDALDIKMDAVISPKASFIHEKIIKEIILN